MAKPKPVAEINSTKNVILEPGKVLITAKQYPTANYTWKKDGEQILKNNIPNFEASTSGNYSLIVENEGCTSLESAAISVTILKILADEGLNEISEPVISPNPNNGVFNLALPKNMQNAQYQLFNLAGSIVLLNKVSKEYHTSESLPKGIYFLKIFNNKQHFTKKLIIK